MRVHVRVANKQIRVIQDGSLIRELTLDPSRDYQPLRPLGRLDLSAMT